MSNYNLNVSSPDMKRMNGNSITSTSVKYNGGTAKMAGNVSSTGPLSNVNIVTTNDKGYNSNVAGMNNAVSPVNWSESNTNKSVANGSSPWVGHAVVTDTTHGSKVGDPIKLVDNASGLYDGVYRVVDVINANSYVINAPFTYAVGTGVDIYHGVAEYSGGPVKKVGYLKEGRYAIRQVPVSVYDGSTTKTLMGSPASEYGRRKIHSMTSVRSKLVESAIRSGYWNIFTGKFDQAVVAQNDFSSFGSDDEIDSASDGFGLKGEFAYKYGSPVAVTGDYDTLS